MRVQLNSILFAKTLVRKDVASSSGSAPNNTTTPDTPEGNTTNAKKNEDEKKDDEDEFSSKAQIMTLMTTDVDRVSEFSWHIFTLFGSYLHCIV